MFEVILCSHIHRRDVVLNLMDKFTFQWFSLNRKWVLLQTW